MSSDARPADTVGDLGNSEANSDRRPPSARRTAGWLYLWRFLSNPGRLASFTPSGRALARLVGREVRCAADEVVVELGAGTGAITHGILEAGLPPEKLYAVEIDPDMARYLRETMPDITVLECDVFDLPKVLPPEVIGRVGTVVCGIPASLLPGDKQRALVDVMFGLMPKGHRFIAYTHRPFSPLPKQALGLVGERLGIAFANIPVASVWGFTRTEARDD